MADDLEIGIGARDKGARRLLNDIRNALLSVRAATLQQIPANRAAAESARAQASAIKDQLAITEALVRDRRRQLNDARRLAAEESRQAEENSRRLVQAAQTRAKAEATVSRGFTEMARERVEQARQMARNEVTSQRELITLVRLAATDRIRVAREAARQDNDNTRAIVLQAKARVNALVDAHNKEIALVRKRINEQVRALRDARQAQASLPPELRASAAPDIAQRRDALTQLREQARAESDVRLARIREERSSLRDTLVIARERIESNRRTVESTVQEARREIAAAREAARQAVVTARERVSVRLAEARTMGTLTAEVIRNGRQEINTAREQGRAIVQAARVAGRARVDQARAAVTASRDEVGALKRTSSEAEKQARALERAAKVGEKALRGQSTAASGLRAGLDGLRGAVLRLVAAYSGFRAIQGFIATGLRFNQIIESSKLGIGALITAEAELVDQHGNLIEGTRALAVAQGLAQTQLDKLRVAGIQTSATTEELVTAFQEAVGAGLSVGLTLDQIRAFTVQVAQAATTINLPFNQLNQEVRSILQGTIDRNSRIAKALQLTNQEVNLAKQQGRLADLLNEKFKAFNIAGAESVNTFKALRSNIQDAFSVFAGAATRPLFEELRDAGLEALKGVFDFRSAEIQESFRGLIQGAQLIFGEIGRAFADAIRGAVRGAESLSDWIQLNREQIKQTAAAIGTMVRQFFNMVGAIGEAVLGIGRMAGGTNSVIGLARVLGAVFESIAENIKLIVALLIAGPLVRSIGALTTLVTALMAAFRGGGVGAAIGTAIGGPGLGTAIGSIIGLLLTGTAAWKLFRGETQAARLETARMTTALQDQKAALTDLSRQYIDINRQLDDKATTDQDRLILEERLTALEEDYARNGGKQYLDIIQKQNLSLKEKREAILGIMRAEATAAAESESDARRRVFELQEEIKRRSAPVFAADATSVAGARTLPPIGKHAAKSMEQLRQELELAETEVVTLTGQTNKLNRALDEAAKERPIIRSTTHGTGEEGAESPHIKEARAQLERRRAEIEADRARNRALLAQGVISAIENLSRQRDLDLAEIDAERKFIEARRVEADRKLRAPKAKPEQRRVAEDELRAIEVDERALGAKREEVKADFNRRIADMTRDRVRQEEDLETQSLRAQGKHIEALERDIRLRTQRALEDAKRQFDNLSPEIEAKIDIVVPHQALEQSLKDIKDEVQRVLDLRTQETKSIEDRFRLRGKLSAREEQERADLISQAHQRAQASAERLRAILEQLRQLKIVDPVLLLEIQALIQLIDNLGIKAEQVDLELEKLKDGLREAATSAIANFFDAIGDETRTLAGMFKEMVKSIVDDLRRLISQMIAMRILEFLAGVLGAGGRAAGGPARGNRTQSEGRAQGGPARPAHGRLHGGIPGVDSIPILAQQDEWFLRPAARRKYGDQFLSLINDLKLPVIQPRRFATGGPVDVGQTATAARPSLQQHEVRAHIGVDEDGLLKVLYGRVGEDATMRHFRKRQREVGQTLTPQRRPR